MKTITVAASRPYRVLLGGGILPGLGEELKKITGSRRLALVSDENVYPLHGERVCALLREAGFAVAVHILPAGEEHKDLAAFASVLSFFAEHRLSRADPALALGGGVVGDITGFAAAAYMRGIDYVQLPTTLLAAVDSSVGGKTGVDLPGGKNLAGAFHQPLLVLCDTGLLSTLPEKELRAGCAEIIKYGLLGDESFFRYVEENDIQENLETVIARCVERKAALVSRDETDRGERKKLNLGHTLGHAEELCSRYTLPHGFAVAMGMAAVCRAAETMGRCVPGTAARVEALLNRCGLPTELISPAEALYAAALSDKKTEGDTLSLVVPTAIGRCEVEHIPTAALMDWLRAGGAK